MAHDIYWNDNAGNTYMRVAGTVRNTGDGWYLIDDAGHESSNCSVGTVTTSSVQILFSQTALKVVEFRTGPDDTFARTPYKATFGASVGLGNALIYGTVSGVAFNPSTWSNASANIWFGGDFLVAQV